MAPFDGKTKVQTRVGIGKDAWKPEMGSLRKGPMTEEALIHGSKKEQIDMNLLSTVNSNRLYRTGANYFCTVTAIRKLEDNICMHTTSSLFKRDVMGVSLYNRVGPTMVVFIAPLVESHSSPRSLSEPAVRMDQVNQAIQNALDESWYGVTTKSAYLLKLEATAISASTLYFGTELNGGKAVAQLIQDRVITYEAGTNPVKFLIQAVSNTIGAFAATTKTTVSMFKFAVNSLTL